MKKYLFIAILSFIIFSVLLAANFYNLIYRGTFLNEKDTRAKFGNLTFTIPKWKKADVPTRAKMAASLLKNKKLFIGKKYHEIWDQLGQSDSYYHSDMLPAYTILENAPEGKSERWHVVFLLNKDNKILDVRVHRQYPR